MRAVHADGRVERPLEIESSHVRAHEREVRLAAGLRARYAEHARGGIDSGDLVSPLGEDQGVVSGPASEVEEGSGLAVERSREDLFQEKTLGKVIDVIVQNVVVLRNLIEEVPRHDR